MDLSLKKARKLESKIAAHIAQNSNNNIQLSVRVNSTIDEIDAQATEARNKFIENEKNLDQLNTVRYSIRRLISETNSSSGIDSFLNEKVELEAKLQRLNKINLYEKYNKTSVEDNLNNQKKMLETSYGNSYRSPNLSFNVPFLGDADELKLKEDRLAITRRIEEIEDKLAELNFSRRISLDANALKLLQDNNLV